MSLGMGMASCKPSRCPATIRPSEVCGLVFLQQHSDEGLLPAYCSRGSVHTLVCLIDSEDNSYSDNQARS